MTFEQSPVYKAQCATFAMCKVFLSLPAGDVATHMDHPVLRFRALPAYRDAHAVALRNTVARLMREQRAAR
jgi:hypothetical protein